MKRRRLALAALALAAVAVPLPARADGNGAMNESYRATFMGAGVASDGAGFAQRAGGPSSASITISTVPAGAIVEKAFLYWATLGADASVTFKGQAVTGQLIGTSVPAWLGYQDSHAYRADVTSAVPGNGTYALAGVGVPGADTDGEGASLVVVYRVPGAAQAATVVINDGALSKTDFPRGQVMRTVFRNLVVPSAPTALRLHVGMADGQSYADNPMKFRSVNVTPADYFDGSDGRMWDDHTIPMTTTLLPAGTTSAANDIQLKDDGLLWIYSALIWEFTPGDTDGDGVNDVVDNCIATPNASQADADGDGAGDACDDSDGDGLTDEDELARGTSPTDADSDDDGVTDGDEVQVHGSDPLDRDTDGDLYGDGTEVDQESDPTNPLSIPVRIVGPVTAPVPPPFDENPVTDGHEPVF